MNFHRSTDARPRNTALLIVFLYLAAAVAVARDCTDTKPAHTTITATFTGEVTAAGPVYRLPPIQIVANRSSELARIERDEQLARAREVHGRTARKPKA